jgi:hypothetical protein
MTNFDQEKFKKSLKKSIKKSLGKKGKKTGGNFSFNVNSKNGPLYFLGFIGAATYYISNASDFWAGVLGLLKAAVWPAFLIYAAFTGLHA